jgi:hypothetical protein
MSSNQINVTPFSPANPVKPTVTSSGGTFAGGAAGPSLESGIKPDIIRVPPPVIGGIIDHVGPVTGNVAPGGTTDDAMPTISGSGARPGDRITLSDNGMFIGAAIVDSNGNWSVTPFSPLPNGPHTFTATETNFSTGMMSSPSAPVSIVIDAPTMPATPPAPIIGGAFDAVGAIKGNIPNGGQTDDTQPAFFGTAQTGDIVRLYDGSNLIGSAIAGPDGRWSIKPAAPLGQGLHQRVRPRGQPHGQHRSGRADRRRQADHQRHGPRRRRHHRSGLWRDNRLGYRRQQRQVVVQAHFCARQRQP